MTEPYLLTIGHGAASQEQFSRYLCGARVQRLIDIRRFPGSRKHPHFGSDQMTEWVPALGIDYVSERRIGGRRGRSFPETPHVGWKVPEFRAYADYMMAPPDLTRDDCDFQAGFEWLMEQVGLGQRTAIMCSETAWWRCHRRLVSDAVVLRGHARVFHLVSGRLSEHQVSAWARLDGDQIIYDNLTLAA